MFGWFHALGPKLPDYPVYEGVAAQETVGSIVYSDKCGVFVSSCIFGTSFSSLWLGRVEKFVLLNPFHAGLKTLLG